MTDWGELLTVSTNEILSNFTRGAELYGTERWITLAWWKEYTGVRRTTASDLHNKRRGESS